MINPVLMGFVRYVILLPLTTLGYVLFVAILMASIPYALCPVYDAPETTPHSGKTLFNPYSSVNDSLVERRWLKANFHAHSVA